MPLNFAGAHGSYSLLCQTNVGLFAVDGSIVPISAYKGIKFSLSQINDYVSGKTIRIDGYQGNPSTVYIKFDPARMVPAVCSSNPDAPHQSKTIPSQEAGITFSTPLSEKASKKNKVSQAAVA